MIERSSEATGSMDGCRLVMLDVVVDVVGDQISTKLASCSAPNANMNEILGR
jgi:hypothetical protein